MTRRHKILLGWALAVPLTAIAIAGCGGSDDDATAGQSTTGAEQSASTAPAATVKVRSTDLGKILVDAQGRSLYLFEADTGPKSTCSGACAAAWPPFDTAGKPTAGAGAKAALIGTTKRSDGKDEVTYDGHPLYYYAGDQKAGDTNGQELDQFGAEWYVLSPSGNSVEGDSNEMSDAGGSY